MSQDPFNASHSISPPVGTPAPTPAPWGLVGTIVWGVVGVCVWGAAQLAVIFGYFMAQPEASSAAAVKAMGTNGFLLSMVTIVGAPAWAAVMAFAAHRRGWRVADYLALVVPTRGQFAFGFLCIAPLLVGVDVLNYATGRDVVPSFMSESYKSAAASGSLLLFFVAVVIVAPVAEEIVFRGFLFRGLKESILGVAGTLAVTSAAWALLHVQYDWLTIVEIFLIGLLFGWLRWASGSTLLTITLHVTMNFVALIETAIWVEWYS
jgi:membrane protease YdiL (CAAX protease family)